jgi:predicted RNase H-like HicB family nuclease
MAVAGASFVVLTCFLEPDTEVGGYVSRCPALSVASQGESLKEAEGSLREAVALYLEAQAEDGQLDSISRQ